MELLTSSPAPAVPLREVQGNFMIHDRSKRCAYLLSCSRHCARSPRAANPIGWLRDSIDVALPIHRDSNDSLNPVKLDLTNDSVFDRRKRFTILDIVVFVFLVLGTVPRENTRFKQGEHCLNRVGFRCATIVKRRSHFRVLELLTNVVDDD